MNSFFTSDWHLGHFSLQRGIRGTVFSSLEEHDATIINNIFETVKPGDNLYFLGDAFWKWDSKRVEEFMTNLKKHRINLHWILGNHDKLSWTKFGCVKWVGQIKDITIEGQPITLCHYPMIVWNRSHHGAWQLYGHIHMGDSTYIKMREMSGTFEYIRGKQVNVNVEFGEGFRPRSFEEIREHMSLLPDNWDTIYKEES